MLVLLCSSSVEEQFARTRRLVDGVWRSCSLVLPLCPSSFIRLPKDERCLAAKLSSQGPAR